MYIYIYSWTLWHGTARWPVARGTARRAQFSLLFVCRTYVKGKWVEAASINEKVIVSRGEGDVLFINTAAAPGNA